MRRTGGRARAGLFLSGIALCSVGIAQPSSATPLARPSVASFNSSPASLPRAGGTITLTAAVANGATCTVTSNRPLGGLPETAPCANGTATWSTSLPSNGTLKPVVYRFTVAVTGVGGSTASRTDAVTVLTTSPPLAGVASILARGYDTCAVQTGGATWCWGENQAGQLGTGSAAWDAGSFVPVRDPTLDGLQSLSLGGSSSCGLEAGGAPFCWGINRSGNLGDGTMTGPDCWHRCTPDPVPVVGLTGVLQVVAGGPGGCALTAGRTVDCWGQNDGHQLGDGSTLASSVPVAVTGLHDVQAIATGPEDSCALLAGGKLSCWGDNSFGELGDGSTAPSSVPVEVSGLDDVTAVGIGSFSICALHTDGTVSCWGGNPSGQLGNGSTSPSLTPARVPGLSGVQSLVVGDSSSCVLVTGGAVDCWGEGTDGQLGDGAFTDSPSPVPVPGLTGVAAIAGGSAHTCALAPSGTVQCWGYNFFGQLGDGARADAPSPVPVSGP